MAECLHPKLYFVVNTGAVLCAECQQKWVPEQRHICHCGWSTPVTGAAYADPPRCQVCDCYTDMPKPERGCELEFRRRVKQVHAFIQQVKYPKVAAYVVGKLSKEFNVSREQAIKLLNEYNYYKEQDWVTE